MKGRKLNERNGDVRVSFLGDCAAGVDEWLHWMAVQIQILSSQARCPQPAMAIAGSLLLAAVLAISALAPSPALSQQAAPASRLDHAADHEWQNRT